MNSAAASLSAFGLALAGTMAVVNVLMEVARKKAVFAVELIATGFWCHVFDTLLFTAAWVFYRSRGYGIYVRGGGNFFGIAGLQLSSLQIFVIYEVIDFLLHGVATWLFFKALQEAALSMAVPFLAFSSILILPAGYFFLGELPGRAQLLGVFLTTVGSVMMHWRRFAVSWLGPFKAIYQNKGCRYMIYASAIFAVLSPLDKKLSLMADPYTHCVIFGVGMCLFFVGFAQLSGEPLLPSLRRNLGWIALAGLLDAGTILLQFQAYAYVDAVVVISIKRSGIVLSVVFGWLFFGEKAVRDRLMASSLMFVGVLILCLPFTTLQALSVTLISLAAMSLYVAVARTGPLPALADETV